LNILFPTQSNGLRMFDAVGRSLVARDPGVRIGFTVADRWFYTRWLDEQPDFESRAAHVVKEWDVTGARAGLPDLDALARFERILGAGDADAPGLFGGIVCDRRLLMGPDCSFSQDYRRRFGDAALLRILQNGCEAMERAFDILKPDLVVGFICVSLLEYLAFLFARARGVRYLNLRTSRIANRVLLSDSHRDPAPEVARALHEARYGNADMEMARRWLAQARGEDARYEGVAAPSAAPAQRTRLTGRRAGAPLRFARTLMRYHASGAAADNHSPGLIRPALFKAVVNPLRARRIDRALRPHYIGSDALARTRHAVFPLHTEPEVSLLVYGRPMVNQIELLRAVALSLPANMILVAKEHPWMVGKRSLAAYRKMLNIPRVRLAPPEMTVRALIETATLVVVHTGSSGLEAAAMGKPVLALGPTMGELLPDTMIRRCADLTRLPAAIAGLLDGYAHDSAALERFVAAIIASTAPLNLYTGLLERAAFAPGSAGTGNDIDELTTFLLARAAEPAAFGRAPGAASW
jgi:hypothetical protein